MFLSSYFKNRHQEEFHNSLGNVLVDIGRVLLERAQKEEDRKQENRKKGKEKLREKKMDKM